MSSESENIEQHDVEAEFSRLFWAARREHVKLAKQATANAPAHSAAVAFANAQTLPWAVTLLEASRMSFAESPEKAFAILAPLESSIPERWKGVFHFVRGSIHNEKGEYDEATKAYRKALDDPKFDLLGMAWNNLGNAYHAKGELDEAIKAFRMALDDPKFEPPGMAWCNLAITYHAKGEHDEATKAYRRALDDPKFESPGVVWNNLGVAYQAKGEHDEAIKAYRKALDDPKYETPAKAWYNLGTAFSAKGEHDEAINAYRNALDDPKCETPGDAWYNVGIAFGAKGEPDAAIKAYLRALDDPKFEPPGIAWNNLGNAYHAKGEYEQAINAYHRALDDPKYETPAKAWVNLGISFTEIDRRTEAEQAFQKGLESADPDGGDHARARRRLELLKAEIKPESLSPDDRALVERSSTSTWVTDLEQSIIDEIDKSQGTQYEKYVKKMDAKDPPKRHDTLSILRGWSSAVTLLEGSERLWRGGGYFITWRGYGIVLDPGFDFLRNFHDAHYHASEINVVIVSHNHPDHNYDLKAIDDLRYELYTRLKGTGKPGGQPYILVWDKDTDATTKFLVEQPEHRCEPVLLTAALTHPIDLAADHPQKIPVRIIPFKVEHEQKGDVPHAMGMRIELLNDDGTTALKIGYTADTGYFPDLSVQLKNCDVLIAHISQPRPEELKDQKRELRKIHLGYWGTAKLLAECKPKLALIGEFWAGLADLRIPLVKGLRQRSGVEHILPTGLDMHILLPTLEIECTKCKKPTPFAQVKIAPPADSFGSLAYLCHKCLIG